MPVEKQAIQDIANKRPWELSKLEVIVCRSYEAEVVGEDGKDYQIEFADSNGEIIEAKISKKEFKNFPYPVETGTFFGIISYRLAKDDKSQLPKVGVWPVDSYWNQTLAEETPPWELSALEITVCGSYAAQIIGETGEEYQIEFSDHDGGIVEAKRPKADFENFPHPIAVGTCFGLVAYRLAKHPSQKVIADSWPLAKYWHHSLRETPEKKDICLDNLFKTLLKKSGEADQPQSNS